MSPATSALSPTDDPWEAAARQFAPRPFTPPGELAQTLAAERVEQQTAALRLIDDRLCRLATGQLDRAMVFLPPQAGKSERCSRRFPLSLLDWDPRLRIAVVSYMSELAVRWGRAVRDDITANPQLGISLRADSKAAGRWSTEQGGGIYCTGIGGSLTGQPVDMLIIDDPVKDRAEAESQTMRDRAWDWWENVAKVRARRTLLIQTRWHVDDLAGRILQREPGGWDVLSIPAVAETGDDPLGRQVGEEIRTPRWAPGHYTRLRDTTSAYVWQSLYQQRPTAATGGIFKRGDWQYWRRAADGKLVVDGHPFDLAGCVRFVTMDLATSTRTSADWTVAAAWAITPFGELLLLDRVRDRVPDTDHLRLLEPLRSRWLSRSDTVWVESRMFGSTLVYGLGRRGLPVAELEADADKLTRALAAAALLRQQRIYLPADAPWLDGWIDEHADFPHTAHDDQVDVTAYAARVLETRWLAPEDDHVANARRVAALTQPAELDFETAIW